ncbi:MAG: phosphatidate cytidylyltransferase [Acidobacteriaceae bacterium]
MKRVITAAVLIPLVLLLLRKGSFLWIVIAAALVAELAVWEYLSIADSRVTDRAGSGLPRVLVVAVVALLFAAVYRSLSLVLPAIGLGSLALLLTCSFRSSVERALPDTAFSIFGVLYCGLCLATLPMIWSQRAGPSLLIFLFSVVWAGDVAALYVGRTWGRTKLSPRLSPNKSWEGSAASLAGSLLIAAGLFFLARSTVGGGLEYGGLLAWWLALAAVLNLFAQVGDLVESAIKRGAGVKDSGAMLPGHGGILDRIDALLLAAPALWYALWVRQFFGWAGWH